MNIDGKSSLLVVNYKPKFLELVRASNFRRSGRVYGDPGGEESPVWIIPNIDVLVSKEGSYIHYINRLKIPILKYEMTNFDVRLEDLPGEISESVCDQLLDLQVYAEMVPIEILLREPGKGNTGLLRRLLRRRQ